MVGRANQEKTVDTRSNGFQKTPLPPDLARPIALTDNARTVLRKRYLRRGDDGQPVETEQEMFWRVAYNIAKAEEEHGGDVEGTARRFYDLLTTLRFFPNSPTFTGAGTPLGQLAACFVLPIDDDMGRTGSGIFETLRHAALIQQTGGGNGFSFSRLRPKGALVRSSSGEATGPVGFLRVYDQAFGEIAQGGSRRGANMSVLRVDHPDIREFITCKTDENAITNFNISVGITDAFMRAVEADSDFDLVNPHDGKVWHTVRARDLFDQIVRQAHHNGEPGVLFLDTANRENPVPHLYELESTNPCFVGSTRMATEHGLLTIAELAELDLPLFVGTDNRAPGNDREKPIAGTQGVALRPASPAWMTWQAAPVLRLTTRKGYSVTATPDHRFLTPDGYVALSDLRPGDRVLLQSGEGAWSRNYELPNAAVIREEMRSLALAGNDHTVQRRDFAEQYENVPEYWSHDLGLVMGWLVGDGWVSEGVQRKSIGFAFADDEALALIHEPLSNWFGPGSLVQRGTVRQLTYGYVPFRFFQTLGVSTKRAHEKRLPESIWTAPREAVVGFLQGLFGADGTVGLNQGKQDCTVRLASSSRILLEDVQILLSNLGIVGRIYQRRSVTDRHMPDGKGGSKLYHTQPQYELVIGKANRDRFAELIGFAHAGKQAKLTAFIAAKKRRSNAETFTDAVLCVEEAGTADVYDLAQPQTHSLIANGLVAHNCGEQFLGPFENCCLGSINLAQHLTSDRRMDWDKLAETVALSTRFLDDVVSANAYVPAVPQLKEAAHRVRRIGLGIMGLADLMYALGVRYGSEEGQEFASQVMEFVRYHAMGTSIALAEERGPFPAIHGSIYDPDHLLWQPPQPLVPYRREWGRPPLDWSQIVEGIKRHGIRNGAQLTVAPTGTISTVAGIEGYGCEPVFALAYTRYVNDNGKQLTLQYTSPQFERALREAGLDGAQIAAIVEQVNLSGTCQDVPGVPEEVRRVFVVSSDVTAEEHVRMQAALQAFTDNAISKTVNFPITATEEDVRMAYLLGWKLGCKGMTVYVTGSREKVVLETAETRQKKQEDNGTPATQIRLFNEDKKPRPRHLEGKTYRVETPLGTTYVTVNENGEGKGQPFEIFLHTAKAGSDTAAVAEALGRLISYILRLASPVTQRNRLREIVRQLSGIGGVRSIGFGPHRVSSLPDGIAQVLQEYLDESEEAARQAGDGEAPVPPGQLALQLRTHPLGDLCPECGAATLVNEEGCRKCYSCGFSEC
ncbi:MAG: LAGLIDADG family homing endonuclease [Chloroflexota bacterium]